MTKLFQALRGGGTSFLMNRWSAGDALEMVARHRHHHPGRDPHPGGAHAGPRALRHAPTSRRVRIIALGGGPATASLVREARRRFGVPVVVRYTCTEAGVGVGTSVDDPPEDAEESVGRARAGVALTIRDDDDRILPAGETGQVCLASAAVMARYHRDPEATAAAFTADGAVRTGDLGFSTSGAGCTCRAAPRRCTSAAATTSSPSRSRRSWPTIPAVAHVAVAAPARSRHGRDRRGRGGGSGPAPTPRRWSRCGPTPGSRLAAHKLPEAILVVTDELPRTAMEKIDRPRWRAGGEVSSPPLTCRRRR